MTASPDRDERLANLLAEVSKAPTIDWQRLQTQHPDLVDELRQLLAVGQIVDVLPLSHAALPLQESNNAPVPRTLGEFELCDEIGRGGMGVVFKACDKN